MFVMTQVFSVSCPHSTSGEVADLSHQTGSVQLRLGAPVS